jgi:superfamily I DNA/RNA helicase
VRTLLNQARQEERPPPRVLVTTYTNALCRFSYQLLARLLSPADLSQVTIQTADKLAYTIARRHGQLLCRIADEKLLRDIMADVRQRAAIGEGRKVPMPPDRLRDAYLLDEFAWVIEGRGVTNLKDYLGADRAGRGIRLTGKDREAVWNLYKAYRKRLEKENVVSWGQVRGRAWNLVRQGKHTVRYDSVLIDEAQDLTPMALGLLVQLCASPEGVCLTADANQSVYARGFTWKDVNERLNFQGRTVLLKRNYRTTREIVAAASSLLSAGGGEDTEALAVNCVLAGPRPILQPYGDIEEMASLTAAYLRSCSLRGRLALSAAAVLTPTHQMGKAVAEALTRLGLPARYMPGNELDLDAAAVKVMTLHSAKGLEFPTVVVTGLTEGVLPRCPPRATPEERQEEELQARRLAFVGMTRAMHNLLVLYSASRPSSLLKNLDESNWDQAPPASPQVEAARHPMVAGP